MKRPKSKWEAHKDIIHSTIAKLLDGNLTVAIAGRMSHSGRMLSGNR